MIRLIWPPVLSADMSGVIVLKTSIVSTLLIATCSSSKRRLSPEEVPLAMRPPSTVTLVKIGLSPRKLSARASFAV